MSFWRKMLLAAISGLLFTAAWPRDGFAPLIFIAFVPLLLISDDLKSQHSRSLQIALFAYIAFVIWNALTTYWVCNSSLEGGVAAITLLSLFFTIVYTTFQFTYKYLPRYWGLLALPVYWIAFEKFHLEWDLTWPWLTLGNVFSEFYPFVQWYEYTGVFGGSLWVLVVNILVFRMIKLYRLQERKKAIQIGGIASALFIVPAAISFTIYSGYTEKVDPVDVVVVQPNIDPWNEKFVEGTYISQTERFVKLALTKMDNKVQYVVGPETAISAGIEELYINRYEEVRLLRRALLRPYPKAVLVTGASTFKFYKTWETPPATASKSQQDGQYYDSYNTAMQFDTSENIQYSHKSKLVPGVERMPFSGKLGWLEKYAINLGGANGTLGVDTIQNVFKNPNSKLIVAPSICYESVYGEYMGQFVKKGAGLIFIITNDGWWKDTPGHRQHCSYARLRAIESRRSIARSGNTGISCFVNQRGDISQPTKYWEPAVIRQTINANYQLTFYTQHGDYIAYICNWLVLGFLFLAFFFLFKKN